MHYIEENLNESRERIEEKKKLLEEAQKSKSPFLSKPSDRIKNISKITMQPNKAAVKKDSGKLKFVELHQYPGYEPKELTPLPHDVTPVEILTKVANAQPSLRKMLRYRPVFEKLFYSAMSQAILQDYPSLLSQAVYAAFCGSFPDSYRMFDPDFKEDLVVLVYEWVVGTRPAPRIWMSWNYKDHEPPGLKQREKLTKQSKSNKAPSVSLDFLDMLGSNNNAGSQSTLNQTGSVSSVSSVGGQVTGQHGRLNRKYYSNKTTKANSLNPSQTADMAAIQAVEKAQNEPATARVQTGIRKSSRGLPVPKAGKVAEPNNEVDGLTTIAEYEENEQRELMKDAKESKASFLLPQRTPSQEFILDAPTYKDLIAETFRTVRERAKNYNILTEIDKEEHKKFIRKQRQEHLEFKKKEALLLSNRSEVKRISDLIMLELKKDHDSIGTGIRNEIDAALAALE
ncbi:hypothetical protein LSH36_6g03066 [Paralvinella palmiformis]|uniref:Uncharacterized protein n=1 Tax=Paralvinella palmiformis TaxID=53620 RepID=A0AAD9NIS2_9ANNE|nr:hypothetical protein LSH36_6g03066 [Paralvinella palmiformis]